MAKTKEKKDTGRIIRMALDGRTQRWLGQKIGMLDTELSNKMNGINKFTQEELDKINAVLELNLIA